MTNWSELRDRLFQRLHRHAVDCLLCRLCTPGVHVHNACETGILLLTEWHLAKRYAEDAILGLPHTNQNELHLAKHYAEDNQPTVPQPTDQEATP